MNAVLTFKHRPGRPYPFWCDVTLGDYYKQFCGISWADCEKDARNWVASLPAVIDDPRPPPPIVIEIPGTAPKFTTEEVVLP